MGANPFSGGRNAPDQAEMLFGLISANLHICAMYNAARMCGLIISMPQRHSFQNFRIRVYTCIVMCFFVLVQLCMYAHVENTQLQSMNNKVVDTIEYCSTCYFVARDALTL